MRKVNHVLHWLRASQDSNALLCVNTELLEDVIVTALETESLETIYAQNRCTAQSAVPASPMLQQYTPDSEQL